MIVRNESARIERCLKSVVNYVSCAVILDTGSDDDTVEKIEKFFDAHGVPCEIYFSGFDDFSSARNRALERARLSELEFDYVLLVDADMELVTSPTFRLHLHGAPAYSLLQRAGTLGYHNTRLLRRDVEARYVGATHEYLDIAASIFPDTIAHFVDHADGANRADKFERDIRLLQEDLKKDPDNQRSWFYLAQSYRDAGDYVNAREAYEKRVLLGGWDEEVWFAQRMIGACNLKLSYEAGFIEETLAAYNRRPQRLEPLYDLAKFFREKGDNALAVLFADAGRDKPMPSDLLFLDEYAHKFGLNEEFSIAGFYLPERRREAFEVCNRLALAWSAPPSTRQLARANILHYVQPLAVYAPTFKAHQIPFAPPPGYVPMNPSVTRRAEQIVTTVRCVNYRIDAEGRYLIRGDDGSITNDNPIHTRNFLLSLTDALVPKSDIEIETVSRSDYPLVRGWEDMRLYSLDDQLYVSANVREANADGWCEQHRGQLFLDSLRCRVVNERYMPGPTGERFHEKNWMPMPSGDFMYKIGHVVDNIGVTAAVTPAPFESGDMRGGSQLITFRGGYLALIHEATADVTGRRAYLHRFVFFDADARPLRASLPFWFQGRQIEFAAGLCWHPDGRRLVMSYGVRDCEAWLATADAHEVAEMLGMV
jgi:tetratricopeptide (TPR) repeat protein